MIYNSLMEQRLHNGAEYTGEYPGGILPSAAIRRQAVFVILPGMDEEKLVAWHRTRAKALLEAGCDLFACETVQEPQECLQSSSKFARI